MSYKMAHSIPVMPVPRCLAASSPTTLLAFAPIVGHRTRADGREGLDSWYILGGLGMWFFFLSRLHIDFFSFIRDIKYIEASTGLVGIVNQPLQVERC